MNKRGLIIIFTGNGKGKTTAAVGTALRAAGQGLQVLIIQFIKKEKSGEILAIEKHFKENLDIFTMGKGFLWDKNIPPELHKKKASEAFTLLKFAIKSQKYQLIILDEISLAINYGFIPVEEVINLLLTRPSELHIIMTGRSFPSRLKALAHTLTEFKELKHHYFFGYKNIKGIDF